MFEEYLYKSDDESDSDTDSDVCNGASLDEKDEINERRNVYDDAMDLAAVDEEIVLKSTDEELAKANRFSYVCPKVFL